MPTWLCLLVSHADGLLEPHGSLSYHHAVFPTPPLANSIEPPLNGRQLQLRKPSSVFPHHQHQQEGDGAGLDHSSNEQQRTEPNAAPPAHMATNQAEVHQVEHAVATGQQPAAVTVGRGKKRLWQEPKTAEFQKVSAYDDPQLVIDRLAQRASVHFTSREGIKEGEFLTNFMFALRMRSHTLRATPPG